MKKKYKIKWFNLINFIIMIISWVFVISDFVMIFGTMFNETGNASWTWLGIGTLGIAIVTGAITYEVIFEKEN